MNAPDDVATADALFSLVSSPHPEFDQVLTKYFEGKHDRRTPAFSPTQVEPVCRDDRLFRLLSMRNRPSSPTALYA